MTQDDASAGRPVPASNPHRLEFIDVSLLGGGRQVHFHQGLNIVHGQISTGKTTYVALLRALLGTMPDNLPPEVQHVRAINGTVALDGREWLIYRPRTTTPRAPVEISELRSTGDQEVHSFRLPVSGAQYSYSSFLLEQLSIPIVEVPQGRTASPDADVPDVLSPVTMTDWLGYCIIPGSEIDTHVMGHHIYYRDKKRKWVFQLIYGYYDPDLARLVADRRRVELQLASADQEAAIRQKFLADTPFQDASALERQLEGYQSRLESVVVERQRLVREFDSAAGVEEVNIGLGIEEIRRSLIAARSSKADALEKIARLESQLKDLKDLSRQLSSQSSRLTRAVVADEWLVDFDFVVCPRCGNDIDPGRTAPDRCYLCGQEPRRATSREELLDEQTRIVSQISETDALVHMRRESLAQLQREVNDWASRIANATAILDQRTAAFVSDQADRIEYFAAEQARLETNIARLGDYLELVRRQDELARSNEALQARLDDLTEAINRRELSQVDAEKNVRALEERILEYLVQLHIPTIGSQLSVQINRSTYLPIIAGRSFDELSSQGLKTLVNVAHALAHHTVAIDRKLPLPGLLVLDGVSANVGSEGFDQDRVDDVYRLLLNVAAEYKGRLQIVVVDNQIPPNLYFDLLDMNVLTLTQEDRLIRIPEQERLGD